MSKENTLLCMIVSLHSNFSAVHEKIRSNKTDLGSQVPQ